MNFGLLIYRLGQIMKIGGNPAKVSFPQFQIEGRYIGGFSNLVKLIRPIFDFEKLKKDEKAEKLAELTRQIDELTRQMKLVVLTRQIDELTRQMEEHKRK